MIPQPQGTINGVRVYASKNHELKPKFELSHKVKLFTDNKVTAATRVWVDENGDIQTEYIKAEDFYTFPDKPAKPSAWSIFKQEFKRKWRTLFDRGY